MQAQGANSRVLRITESTWGTTPAITPGDTVVLPVTTCDFKFGQPRREVRHLGGSWNPTRPVRDRSNTEGRLNFLLNGTAHAFALVDLLGAPVTTGAGAPYTHTFKLGAPPVGASFEVGETELDLYDLYRGMRLVSAGFKLTDTGPIECALAYRGKAQTEGVASLDSAPVSYADLPFDLGVALGAATLHAKVGGVDVVDLLSVEFSVERPAGGPSFPIGSQGIPASLPLKKPTIKGTAAFEFGAWTRFTASKAGTETSLDLLVGVGTGAGTAGNEQVQFVLPEVVFEPQSPQIAVDDGVVHNVPFWAYYADGADATALKVILKNALAVVG